MEIIITILVLVLGIVGVDVAATAFGADSRDAFPDDHAR